MGIESLMLVQDNAVGIFHLFPMCPYLIYFYPAVKKCIPFIYFSQLIYD